MEEFLGIPDMYSKAVKLEKGFNEQDNERRQLEINAEKAKLKN